MLGTKYCVLSVALVTVFGLSGCGGGSSSSSSPVSVSVTASATTVDATNSVTLTATVANDKNAAGVSWSVSGGGTLSNSTTSSTTYTAPSTVSSSLTVTVTATSHTDGTKSGSATLTVPATPKITTSSLPAGTVGTAYSATLAGSGGITPYTWTISAGTLPAGLSLSTAGVLSGTPTAAGVGTSSLTFKLTDSGKATALTATQQLSLTINPGSAIVFSTTSLADGFYNVTYSATVTATGGVGTLTYSISGGSLPTGLSISTGGVISGTPTVPGTFPFTIKASDGFGDSATKDLSITVNAPTITISPTTLQSGVVGVAYSQTLTATGGTGTGYVWTLANGSTLPGGLTLSGNVISGTPTNEGNYNFAVKVTDSALNSNTANLSMTIGGVMAFITTTLPTASAGSLYTQQVSVSGGAAPYSYSVSSGTLPSWVTPSQDTATGVITLTGTPQLADVRTTGFSIKVSDSTTHSVTQSFLLTVYSNAGGHNSYLNGQYAFLASGWADGLDANTTYKAAIVGSFIADGNGKINGLLDYNDALGHVSTSVQFVGSYALDTTNLGEMTMVIGSNRPMTMAFAVGGVTSNIATAGSIVEFDDTTGIGQVGGARMSGEFAKQTTTDFATNKLTGGYAFGMDGETCPPENGGRCSESTDIGPLSLAGVLNFTGDGSVPSGQEDIVVGATTYNEVGLKGSYGVPDVASGRVALIVQSNNLGTTTLPSGDGGMLPSQFAAYMIDASRFYVVSIDDHASYGLMVGKAAQQSGTFSASSFSGEAIVWGVMPSGGYTQNWSVSGDSSASVALVGRAVGTPGDGTIALTLQQNQSGVASTQTPNGTYAVDSKGRMTLSGITGNVPVFYLSGTNQGFGTMTGGNHGGLLFMEPQTSKTVSAGSYYMGTFTAAPTSQANVGVITVTGLNFTFLGDTSSSDGSLSLHESNAIDSFTVDSTGLINFNDGGIGYVVSATKVVRFDVDSTDSAPSIHFVQK